MGSSSLYQIVTKIRGDILSTSTGDFVAMLILTLCSGEVNLGNHLE